MRIQGQPAQMSMSFALRQRAQETQRILNAYNANARC